MPTRSILAALPLVLLAGGCWQQSSDAFPTVDDVRIAKSDADVDRQASTGQKGGEYGGEYGDVYALGMQTAYEVNGWIAEGVDSAGRIIRVLELLPPSSTEALATADARSSPSTRLTLRLADPAPRRSRVCRRVESVPAEPERGRRSASTLGVVATRVYVETSIPSFFFEERPEPDMVARRTWTRDWWTAATGTTELVTSIAVIEELERGEFAARESCLELVAGLAQLGIDQAVLEIVQAYIHHRVMPADPAGDALHLALASYHRCDFLVTWNCRHIANANKFCHIRRVNTLLGLYNPSLVTPLELLGGTEDAE